MESFAIVCPDGRLTFTRDQLTCSPFIKGTVIAATFFPISNLSAKPELGLTWKLAVAERLIPLIREGIIYSYQCQSHDDFVHKSELIKLLIFLAGDNTLWQHLAKCLETGIVDNLGYQNFSTGIYDATVVPYDKKESIRIREEIIRLITPRMHKLVIKTYGGRFSIPIADFNIRLKDSNDKTCLIANAHHTRISGPYSVKYDNCKYIVRRYPQNGGDDAVLGEDGDFHE